MNGSFTRLSPSSFSENSGVPVGWFVVSWRWIPDQSQRRMLHGRLFKISQGKRTVYRILRFSARLTGGQSQEAGEIVVDWPAWLELNDFSEKLSDDLILKIEQAPRWELWRLAFSHPEPAYRLAGILGIVSVALGVLSLILALLAFG